MTAVYELVFDKGYRKEVGERVRSAPVPDWKNTAPYKREKWFARSGFFDPVFFFFVLIIVIFQESFRDKFFVVLLACVLRPLKFFGIRRAYKTWNNVLGFESLLTSNGKTISIAVNREGLHGVTANVFDSTVYWRDIKAVWRFDDGFLFMEGTLRHWLPDRNLTEGSLDEAEQTIASHASCFVRAGRLVGDPDGRGAGAALHPS